MRCCLSVRTRAGLQRTEDIRRDPHWVHGTGFRVLVLRWKKATSAVPLIQISGTWTDRGLLNCPKAGYLDSSVTTVTKSLLGYAFIYTALVETRADTSQQLDICDLGHTFGITVMCLASVSDLILHSVLDFTTSLSQAGEVQSHGSDSPSAPSDGYAAQFPPAVFSTRLLCQVLAESKRILTNDLGESPHHSIAKLGELFTTSPVLLAARSLNVSLYYLSLRLGKLQLAHL